MFIFILLIIYNITSLNFQWVMLHPLDRYLNLSLVLQFFVRWLRFVPPNFLFFFLLLLWLRLHLQFVDVLLFFLQRFFLLRLALQWLDRHFLPLHLLFQRVLLNCCFQFLLLQVSHFFQPFKISKNIDENGHLNKM